MDTNDLIDTSFLKPIDVQRLAQELDLEKRAAQRATVTDPAVARAMDSALYMELKGRVDGRAHGAEQDALKHMESISQLMLSQAASLSFAEPRNRIEGDLSGMRIEYRASARELSELRQRYAEDADHFREWRFARGLKRSAKDAEHPLFYFLDVFVLCILESLVNMYFFATGDQFGLVGGLFFALFVSVTNIALAFLAGFFVTKRINSIVWAHKLIGWIGSIAFLPLLVGFHYLVTQYRAQEQIASDHGLVLKGTEYFARAVAYIMENPLRVPDLTSLILFVLGLLFGLYTWRKGYLFGDPYPGYTRLAKALERRRENLDECETDLLDRLAELRDGVITRISRFVTAIPGTLIGMEQNANAAEEVVGHLETFLANCQSAKDVVTARYTLVGCGGIRPAVFDEPDRDIGNDRSELRRRRLQSMRQAVHNARESGEDSTAEADAYRRQVIAEIDKLINALGVETDKSGG